MISLSHLNKIILFVIFLIILTFNPVLGEEEPADIWEKKENQNENEEDNEIDQEKDITIESPIISDDIKKIVIKIDENTIIGQNQSVIGIFDPAENNFNLNMWSKTDGEDIKKVFNGISKNATEKDWSKEYLLPIVSVKCVKSVEDAVNHINKYGTMHTDAIVTQNNKIAKYFLKNIKSSIAIHNSSTQFADGGEFGFGGEVGISTYKLPPRGPVGLNQLVSYKYEVIGTGQIRK